MPTTSTRPRPLAFLSLLSTLVLLLVTLVPTPAHGSALTTTINANERTCFYALVDKSGEKVRSWRAAA